MAEVDSRWRSVRVFSSADWMPLKNRPQHWRQRRRRTVLYLTDDPEAVAFIIGNVSRIRAFEVGGGDCAKQRGAPSNLQQGAAVFPVAIASSARPRAAGRRTSWNGCFPYGLLLWANPWTPCFGAAWTRPRSCPHNPARPRFPTRTTPCRRPSHILERTLRRPVIWAGTVLSGGSK